MFWVRTFLCFTLSLMVVLMFCLHVCLGPQSRLQGPEAGDGLSDGCELSRVYREPYPMGKQAVL